MKTQPIIIIGGGFAGLRAALELDKLHDHDVAAPIFLIDSSPYHIYTPTLHEIVSQPVPRISAIPFEMIFEGTHIHFIQERVISVDTEMKQVITDRRRLRYGDLILAVGSLTRPLTAKKDEEAIDALVCHTIEDVLKLRKRIDVCFMAAHQHVDNQCHNHFIIVGGGPTGVAFAAGIYEYIQQSALEHGISAKGAHITLLEAKDRILPQLSPAVSKRVTKYLKQLGISIRTNTTMTWKGHNRLTMNGIDVPKKTIVWTVGVKPHPIVQQVAGLRHDAMGRILVDSTLQAVDMPHVWAVGDAAAVMDNGIAETSVAHGRHVAQAIVRQRREMTLLPYIPQEYSVILPLGTRRGLLISGSKILDGILVIWYKRYKTFRYFLSILPFMTGIRMWMDRGEVVEDREKLCHRSSFGYAVKGG